MSEAPLCADYATEGKNMEKIGSYNAYSNVYGQSKPNKNAKGSEKADEKEKKKTIVED